MGQKIKGNWFAVSHKIVESDKFKKMNLSSRILYFYMAKLSNRFFDDDKEGWFYLSLRNLAKEAGLNVNSIKKAKIELIEKEFIEDRQPNYIPLGKKLASKYRIKLENKS